MIGFLYPDVCNQQGDLGYKDWLISNGIDAVDIGDSPVCGITGVVIGDVSERGLEMLSSRLENHWLADAVNVGLTVLAIGNAARIFAKLVKVETALGTNKSEFVETEFLGRKIYGFINGNYDLDFLVTEHQVGEGRLIQCALLGPVCVVNPWFEEHCFGIQTNERDDLVLHYQKLARD
jgi:hypothetical protein